ncbi:hypothetical protein [Sphingorhabdus sp.]|uniref:hypothetical protein n=1 Tax=Sphingorhabdus sp. TaxID=1902408 RepID=UPI0039199CA0
MFTLISRSCCAALVLVALAGCGGDSDASDGTGSGNTERDAADGKIECALAGSDHFERLCSTEQIAANGATILVLRHPDGGFRRFNVLTDGRGLAAADGFDETRISVLEGSMIELSSGDDRYRLPAQIRNATSTQDNKFGKDAS